jgi:biopolymer transport protein ExbD
MSKFRKKTGGESPAINTSSLPDIVFMLLFFFMVATKMRDKEVKVRTAVPVVSEVEKVQKRSWVNFILVGPPTDKDLGTSPRIQLDGAFSDVEEVGPFIISKVTEHAPAYRPYLTTSIKADNTVRMGLIQDIKQELRKVNSLKLLYSANKGDVQND